MTAAALGSQLSVAGTVVGAALASIIAAVAGSLYTASLRRTRDKVRTAFWTGQPNEVDEPTVMEIVPDREGHVAGQRSHLVAPEPIDPSPRRRKLNWKRVVVAALVTFGIAAVSLTVFELATGQRPFRGRGHHDSAGPRGQRRHRSRTARRRNRRRNRRRSLRPLRVRRLPPSRAKVPPPRPRKRRPHRHPRPKPPRPNRKRLPASIASPLT